MGKNVKCFTLLQKYADIYKKKNAGIKNLINIDINNLLESGIEIFYIQQGYCVTIIIFSF